VRFPVAAWIVLLAATAHADLADDTVELAKASAPCPQGRAHCFGIQLHVATDDTGLVVAPHWVAAELAEANRHFAAIDVGFTVVGADALPSTAVHVVTRKDRDAIAVDHLGRTIVDVFLIGKLEDVDDPGAPVHGVTWHAHATKYVIVASDAFPRTLTHELGHVFGLPHSTYAISIMNKTPRDDPPMDQRTFAPEEIVALRAGLRRLLRDGVLVDLPKPQ
jgi:hypothetical protein